MPPANAPPRPDVGFRADAGLRTQAALDLPGVCADRLAQARDLVGKRDGKRQPGVDAVFGHLGGFGTHPEDFVAKGREQRCQRLAGGRGARAHDDALGMAEDFQRLAEPQIFRRAGEGDAGMPCFQVAAGSGGNLGRNEDGCARSKRGQTASQPFQDVGHVGDVVFVDRRVIAHPEHVGRRERGGSGIVGESEPAGIDPGAQELVQARLEQRRLGVAQGRDERVVVIQPRDGKMFRATGGGHATQMPEAKDDDVHTVTPGQTW